MTAETETFLADNKRALTREYVGYVESMIDDAQYEEMESFLDWVDEELQVAREYERQGTPLNDYIL